MDQKLYFEQTSQILPIFILTATRRVILLTHNVWLYMIATDVWHLSAHLRLCVLSQKPTTYTHTHTDTHCRLHLLILNS